MLSLLDLWGSDCWDLHHGGSSACAIPHTATYASPFSGSSVVSGVPTLIGVLWHVLAICNNILIEGYPFNNSLPLAGSPFGRQRITIQPIYLTPQPYVHRPTQRSLVYTCPSLFLPITYQYRRPWWIHFDVYLLWTVILLCHPLE